MKTLGFILSLAFLFSLNISAQAQDSKLTSKKTHIKFYSHTSFEDIEANNYGATATIDKNSGALVFSVPMQGFEFEKSLMQKHYNSNKFLDTKKYPKGKLKGKITNIGDINFDKDGTYNAIIEGEMTIKGSTKNIKEKGTVTVKGSEIVAQSVFNLTLADYGVSFAKGKPSTNIAKTIEITVKAEY